MSSRHFVVLAGGLGTRLTSLTGGAVPKILVPVNGRPFLDYKLNSISRMGGETVTILLGSGGDQVVEYLSQSDNSGLHISCIQDGECLLGTGGSIRSALDHLPDDFWVTYGDSYVIANLDAVDTSRRAARLSATMTVMPNNGSLGASNVAVIGDLVVKYEKTTTSQDLNFIDFGLLYFSREHFFALPFGAHADLGDVISMLITKHALHAYPVGDRFWEIGTPDALRETEKYFQMANILDS